MPTATDELFITDVAPETTHEYSCEVCGIELKYGGRGRHPTRCDDHKKTASKGTRSSTRIKGTNEQLAAQATEVLVQTNMFTSLGVRMVGLPLTAQSIMDAEDDFRRHTYEALLLDAKLCKRILTIGGQSAALALFISYGALVATVAPIATAEFRAKREAAALAADDNIVSDDVLAGMQTDLAGMHTGSGL